MNRQQRRALVKISAKEGKKLPSSLGERVMALEQTMGAVVHDIQMIVRLLEEARAFPIIEKKTKSGIIMPGHPVSDQVGKELASGKA